jgi:hypothetical protein
MWPHKQAWPPTKSLSTGETQFSLKKSQRVFIVLLMLRSMILAGGLPHEFGSRTSHAIAGW